MTICSAVTLWVGWGETVLAVAIVSALRVILSYLCLSFAYVLYSQFMDQCEAHVTSLSPLDTEAENEFFFSCSQKPFPFTFRNFGVGVTSNL